MNLEELNELDFGDIGIWPTPVKLIIILILCAGVATGVYFYDIQDQYKKLTRVEKEEKGLRLDFESKQAKAVNLGKYKTQLEEMREKFGAMLRQLPDKTEVAELLVDVSQTGLAAGLEFELFQPQGEAPREFYAELPIKLEVIGTYHEFGEFVSGLAALPRIVTIHNVAITPGKINSNGKQQLKMSATAKTYRYLDDEG